VSRGAALWEALLVTLATPATWPLALGAFLLRGGVVLVALPLVVLPTPVGIANLVAPTVNALAFGAIEPGVVVQLGGVVVAFVVWLLLGGWVAAALEAEGIRLVAADEGVAGEDDPGLDAGDAPGRGTEAARILTVRLLADLPLAVGLVWASIRLILATYRELTAPGDLASPLAVRVVASVPDALILVAITWVIGEIVGASAARRVVLRRESVGSALAGGAGALVRGPLGALARFGVPLVALGVVVGATALASSVVGTAAGSALDDGTDPVAMVVPVVALVTLWLVGLALIAVVCAWRAAVWTVAGLLAWGTFGGSRTSRPGDWRSGSSSATL
jgi:hypothetical protein